MIPLTTLIDLQGMAGWTAMLVPFGLLAFVLGFALFDTAVAARRRSAGAVASGAGAPGDSVVHAEIPAPTNEPSHPLPTVVMREAPADVAAPPSVAMPPPAPPAPKAVSAPPPPPAAPAIPPPATPADTAAALAALTQALAHAEAIGDDAEEARLSLEIGRRLPHGDAAERHLRRAVILATQLRDTRLHSAARLELGDRVAARGDMTTACEHWQIARQIYWDENRANDLAEADRRMIAAGCPTDWVLNDF